jgi:monoamine oxidase
MLDNTNLASQASFEEFVADLKPDIKRRYDRAVNRELSQQNWQGLFKRNVVMVLKAAYDDALGYLEQLPFDTEEADMMDDMVSLTNELLKPFDGFADEVVQYALNKHRTSCALSNFPDEHKPSQEYIADVIQEVRKVWNSFILRLDIFLRDNAVMES